MCPVSGDTKNPGEASGRYDIVSWCAAMASSIPESTQTGYFIFEFLFICSDSTVKIEIKNRRIKTVPMTLRKVFENFINNPVALCDFSAKK